MFPSVITRTPVTTQEADAYFDRISYQEIHGDVTFGATLRALVFHRLKENEKISFNFYDETGYRHSIPGEGASDSDVIRAMKDIFPMFPDNPSEENLRLKDEIWLRSVARYTMEDRAKIMKMFVDHIELFKGWRRIPKVNEYYKSVAHVECFVNEHLKTSLIMTDSQNTQFIHYMQTGIVVYLPWYFPKEKKLSQDEIDIIQSLRMKTPEKYMKCLQKSIEGIPLRDEFIKKQLKGFSAKYEQRQLRNYQNQNEENNARLNDLEEHLNELLRRKHDIEAMILGLTMKINEGEEDTTITEYFMRNKNVDLQSVDRDYMTIVCRGYLMYFDDEMAKTFLANKHSYFYSISGKIPAKDIELLMRAIFVDEEIKMRMCAAYRFNYGGSVSALSGYGYDGNCIDYTPNPHIDRYSCLGDYERAINSCLREYDYIGAVEQCCASVGSLNLGDSAVMSEFMRRIQGSDDSSVNMKCLELPNGEIVTPLGAIKYLKEKEGAADGKAD